MFVLDIILCICIYLLVCCNLLTNCNFHVCHCSRCLFSSIQWSLEWHSLLAIWWPLEGLSHYLSKFLFISARAPFFNLHVSLLDLGDSKPEFMDGQSIFIELRCSIHMWLCLRVSAAQFWIIRTSSIWSAFPPPKYLSRFKLFVVLVFLLKNSVW
jgi:hypothetical protein